MSRLRILFTSYPAPGLSLGDTPRPNCARCDGNGGWQHQHVGSYGEYGRSGTCHCWSPDRNWRLIRLPAFVGRWFRHGDWPR